MLLSSDIVAFKEEFYELIDDVDAPPKQEQHTETEAIHTEKSEEKQKQTEHNWAWVDREFKKYRDGDGNEKIAKQKIFNEQNNGCACAL